MISTMIKMMKGNRLKTPPPPLRSATVFPDPLYSPRIALKLDPTFARAYAGLSFTHWQNAFQRWGGIEFGAQGPYGRTARRSRPGEIVLTSQDDRRASSEPSGRGSRGAETTGPADRRCHPC